MPSQPLDSLWNFGPVFDIIGSDNTHDLVSPALRPAKTRLSAALPDGGVGLGNFSTLYESLGMQPDAEALLPPLDESELSTSDDALLPSPVTEAVHTPKTHANLSDEEANNHFLVATSAPATTTKRQRRKARRQAEKALLESTTTDDELKTSESSNSFAVAFKKAPKHGSNPYIASIPTRALSNVGAKIRPASPVLTVDHEAILAPQTRTPTLIHSGLVPRTVRPVSVARNSHHGSVQPILSATPSPAPAYAAAVRASVTIRPQIDRHFHLFEKLLKQFPEERKWLIAPRQMVNENTTTEGIHVFVDASNIMIGFKDMLRSASVQSLDMSFDSLALLMERRRPVAKRCFVGSHREANPLPQVTRLIETSKAVGYECSVQEQVYIAREESKKKKFFNDVSRFGWQKAIQKRSGGSGSDSETGAPAAPRTPSAPKWVEQGVDELLHLKMCQSMLDTEVASTMVLATGDGAEAEMSDGFLAHVERALRLGWKVELITWRQQTNGGYKRKAFRQKWGEQFTITELDDFLEDLIDTP
ncbi:hypothetical protein ACEQ8H_001119 [Pleosporales sp. CAS-2024a]